MAPKGPTFFFPATGFLGSASHPAPTTMAGSRQGLRSLAVGVRGWPFPSSSQDEPGAKVVDGGKPEGCGSHCDFSPKEVLRSEFSFDSCFDERFRSHEPIRSSSSSL